MMVLAPSVFVVSVVLAAQSQDRFTLKSANGIALSEFKVCHGCHTAGAKARDFVYTSYAKR
jgi:hypothetical protein